MKGTFDLFQKRFRAVITQVTPCTGVYRINTKLALARRFGSLNQRVAQKLIEGLTKCKSTGTALLLDALQYVLIERNGRSDAHDAFIVAS